MKVVLSWLREFVRVEQEAEDLAEILNAKGIHVEEILRPWEGLEGVVVARVLEVRDHPDSDTLCVATVDVGPGGRMEVVAGVRNMRPGDLVPYAVPGARVPALPEPLGVRKIRGVESNGMLCSPMELAIAPSHSGILILPPGLQPGVDVKATFGLDDAVLDVEIEPNRPDLMCVFGIAREVAAATGLPLTRPDTAVEQSREEAGAVATVEVRDLERCPRYLARVVRGVSIGPSPISVQARLTAAGMRPLWNAVDATNYAMLELGQPLHPFDLALLEGGGIIVRRAEQGERIVTLDDVERTLTAEDLVIADHAKAMAIAGVMGSAGAEVHPRTQDIFLESANFERRGVLRTARRLALHTEASSRFERGVDPEAVGPTAARAASLIAAWSGGSVLAGAVEQGSVPERRHLTVRAGRASRLLGYPVSPEGAAEAFESLGIEAVLAQGDEVDVEVPGYRVDLEREVDLIEEIVRVEGYDLLPSTRPGVRQAGGVADSFALRRRIRDGLVRAGLREAYSLSFASRADLELMGRSDGVLMANPLTSEEAWLRRSLVPGLLKAVARNGSRGVRGVALFETGHVFAPGDGDEPVDEREHVAFVLAGTASSGYPGETRTLGFFDAKGALETLFAVLGIGDWELGEPPGVPFHPARSAAVLIGGQRAGAIGELRPQVTESSDLPAGTSVAELEAGVLGRHAASTITLRDVPRYPPIHRDLAFVVDEAIPAADVRRGIERAAGALLDRIELFDVFAGAPIAPGKKSLAYSLDFRAPDRTLTDEEAEAAVTTIVERLAADVGAELRAG